MNPFISKNQSNKVVFASGSLGRIAEEVDELGASRPLVLCSPSVRRVAERAARQLGARVSGIYELTSRRVPVQAVLDARQEAVRRRADCYLAIGGGSVAGLAKAITLHEGRRIVAVPTTYSGCEMNSVWSITSRGETKSGIDPRVLPKTVIYDPKLTLDLPTSISAASAMSAIARCVQTLGGDATNPMRALMAEEGIRLLAANLPTVIRQPDSIDAREKLLCAAWLAGAAQGAAERTLHNRLADCISSRFGLPSAQVDAAILPHTLAYAGSRGADALEPVAHALGVRDAAAGLFDLAAATGAPTSLGELGVREDDLEEIIDLAGGSSDFKPASITRSRLRMLLTSALCGDRPSHQAGPLGEHRHAAG